MFSDFLRQEILVLKEVVQVLFHFLHLKLIILFKMCFKKYPDTEKNPVLILSDGLVIYATSYMGVSYEYLV